mgnify:CR=1 FL=1
MHTPAMTATSVLFYEALARDIEVEDTGVAALKWRSGAMGTINVTMLTYPKNFEGSITILGERGSVRVGGVAVNEIKHWQFERPDAMDTELEDASYQTPSVYGFGHALYYDNVIETLRGQAQPDTDGREGLRSLELLIAMYMSARDGKRIKESLALARTLSSALPLGARLQELCETTVELVECDRSSIFLRDGEYYVRPSGK